VLAALDGTGVRAVLVAPPDLVPDPLPDVLVRPSVPQLPLLERMDAVVCHGGHNTACEALARGVPLVVAPIRDDQPVVAAQVVAAGAGIRVKFGRVGPAELRAAILAVLDDPAYRDAARQVAESFARAGGAPMAATRLEALLPVPEPV
jgi:MGT family glycosyltransferase